MWRCFRFLALGKPPAVGLDKTRDACHDGGFVICRDGLFLRLIKMACKATTKRAIVVFLCTRFLKKNSRPPNIMGYELGLGRHMWCASKARKGHTEIHRCP